MALDRRAMIELRRTRGRWSDTARMSEGDDAAVDVHGADDPSDEPIEVVLAAPYTGVADEVRRQAADEDLAWKLSALVDRADHLHARLRREATHRARPAGPIDLRDGASAAAAAATAPSSRPLDAVVIAIRQLTDLRDRGLLTPEEYDEKLAGLVDRV